MAEVEFFEGDMRVWLRRTPQPHQVKVETPEGPKLLAPPQGNARNKWVQVEDAIKRLRAFHVEALDKSGAILRMCDLEVETVEGDTPAEAIEPARQSKYERELTTVARLLAQAQKDGAAIVAQQHEASFAKLLEVVSILSGRLNSFETMLSRLDEARMRRIEEDAAAAEEEAPTRAEGLAEMLAPLVAGMLQGQSQRAAIEASKPNGAATVVPKES